MARKYATRQKQRDRSRLTIISTKEKSKTRLSGAEVAHIGNRLNEVTRNLLLEKHVKMSAR